MEVAVKPEMAVATRRTAKYSLREKGKNHHAVELRNTLYLTSVYRFPTHLPGSLQSEGVKESEKGQVEFRTSQKNAPFAEVHRRHWRKSEEGCWHR